MTRRLTLLALVGSILNVLACDPDLSWVPPKDYTPPPVDSVVVEGLGVDDTVAILPPVGVDTIHKRLTNAGNASINTPYAIHELVERLGLVSPPPAWTVVDTVVNTAFAGPVPIAPGDTVAFDAAVTVDSCGLYRETLFADSGNAIGESDENNNAEVDWFFIQSAQHFNIGVTIQDPDETMVHADNPTNTHTFNVMPAGVNQVIYAGFSYVATAPGDSAFTVPAPDTVLSLPFDIQMWVQPREHTFNPGFGEVLGKVTIISPDGCVLKQQSAKEFVEHETP